MTLQRTGLKHRAESQHQRDALESRFVRAFSRKPVPAFQTAALVMALVAASLAPGGCKMNAAPEPAPAAPLMTELPGQRIAETYCAACHAIGRTGESPHLEARPFRQFSLHYPVRSLEEALAEGIVVGHPDMPPFRFEPDDIDKLLDYIESIQDPA